MLVYDSAVQWAAWAPELVLVLHHARNWALVSSAVVTVHGAADDSLGDSHSDDGRRRRLALSVDPPLVVDALGAYLTRVLGPRCDARVVASGCLAVTMRDEPAAAAASVARA